MSSLSESLQLPLRRQSFTPRPPSSGRSSFSKQKNSGNPRLSRYVGQAVNKLEGFEVQEAKRKEQLRDHINQLRLAERKKHVLKQLSQDLINSDVHEALKSQYDHFDPPKLLKHKATLVGQHAVQGKRDTSQFVEQNQDAYLKTPQEKMRRCLRKIRFIQLGLAAIQETKYDGLNSYVNQLDNFKSVKQDFARKKMKKKLLAAALENGKLTFDQRRHVIDKQILQKQETDGVGKHNRAKKHNKDKQFQQTVFPTVNQILERTKKAVEKKQSCVECGQTMNPALRARAFVNRIKVWSKLYDSKNCKQASFLNYNEPNKHLFTESVRLNAAEITNILLKKDSNKRKNNSQRKSKIDSADCDPYTIMEKEEHRRMKETLLKSAKVYAKDIIKQHKYMTGDETVTTLANIKLISKKANKSALKTLKYLNDASAHNDILQCEHRKHIDRTCKVVSKNQESLRKHLRSLLDETNGLLHKNKQTTQTKQPAGNHDKVTHGANVNDANNGDDDENIVIDSESMLGHFNRLQDNQAKISEETEIILEEFDDLIQSSKTNNDMSIRKLRKTIREFKKLKKSRKSRRTSSATAVVVNPTLINEQTLQTTANSQESTAMTTNDRVALNNMNLTIELAKKNDIIDHALKSIETLRFRRYSDEQFGVDYILNHIHDILMKKQEIDEQTEAFELQQEEKKESETEESSDDNDSENPTLYQASRIWHKRVKEAGSQLHKANQRNKELENMLKQAMKRIALFEQQKYLEKKYMVDTQIERDN